MKLFLGCTVVTTLQPTGTLHNNIKGKVRKALLNWSCRENLGQKNAITWADWAIEKIPLILTWAQKQSRFTFTYKSEFKQKLM